jgi:hypothetical protein
MDSEIITILATFLLLSICFWLKRHCHFVYLKETDSRLRGIEKMNNLILGNKSNLESYLIGQLFNGIIWKTVVPAFRRDSMENEKARTVAKKIRLALISFYVLASIFLVEILSLFGVL